MEIFARYGVADTVVTDNGPQFSGADFAGFAQSWGFEHVTSSPHFAQSNGKAENAVKTIKHLFQKCKIDNTSEFCSTAKLEKHTKRRARGDPCPAPFW